jgi:hypothetical protein
VLADLASEWQARIATASAAADGESVRLSRDPWRIAIAPVGGGRV